MEMNKKDIKLLIMDVDGTLTDGKIYIGEDGELLKVFNAKDGCGIHDILIPAGIHPIIMTGRKSKIVENRCKELGITSVYQGISNKLSKLHEIMEEYHCKGAQIAYIGDDINDLACINFIKEFRGLTGCPGDAVKRIKQVADYVCEANGGNGAVREFIEWIVNELK